MTGFQTADRSVSFRILLVEDNDINRQLLSDYLKYYGYNVLSLAEGSDFFSTLEEFQPHIVLLDLKLPGMDGFTLLQQMQEHPDYASIPVIIVSALAFQADQKRANDLGGRRYFVKPLNLTDLRQAIQEELNRPTE